MVMKVKRETLEACMTCPLCHKLLKDATTISLCLHTFCRKCIYEKLSDEEMDCCPVCNIDLGCLPVEKLRPDHNLQDIRSKIFPFKRKNITAQEVVPSLFLPAKRKERSLSSLVVSAPKVSTHTGFTGKRTKTGTRKAAALHGSSFIAEKSIKTEETHYEDNLDSSIAESSKKHRPNEDTNNNMDLIEGKVDLWTPLNCLVEAANRTKSSRSNLQGTPLAKLELPTTPRDGLEMSETTPKSELPTSVQSELHIPKTENKNNGQKIKFGDDKDGNALPSGPVKRRRQRPAGQKRAAASEMSASAQVMLDATVNRCNRKNSPIWFSLVASEDQKGDVSEVASEIVEGLISEPNSSKFSAHIISSPSAPPMPLSIPSSSSTKLTFPSFSPTLREEYIKQQVELIEIEKYREMDLAISAQIWTALEEFYSNWNKWNLEYEERLERMALKKGSCSEQAIAVWYLHHLLKQQKINKRLLAASTWKRSALPSSVQWQPSPAPSPAPSPTHINPASAMVVYSPDSAQSSKSGCIEVSKEVFEKPVENNAKFEKFIETSTKRQDELAESRQTMLESQQRMLESQQRIIEMLKIILDRLAKPKEL